MQSLFEYSEEVAFAKQHNQPILALESTLITHGLPYPHNLEIALEVEEIARKQQVTPATIALMNGKIKIGLSSTELEILIQDKQSIKASRRDIPYVISQKLNAGTTVASTLFCAHKANIKVFATGGIGGVHRGEDQDISADLIELAQSPIAIVCAGAKAILDLPKTLEFLETFSISVIAYQTDTLPAFYSATSAYPLFSRINEVTELAHLLKVHWQLGMTAGVLIANPIPRQDEIAADVIEPAIHAALQLAQQKNIRGKAITPFLLNEIVNVTEGRSLQANKQLIKNNVHLGAQLAKALSTN